MVKKKINPLTSIIKKHFSDLEKNQTIEALNNSAGYISSLASKQVVLRFFPSLKFKLDTSLDEHMRIEELIQDIQQKRDEQQSS